VSRKAIWSKVNLQAWLRQKHSLAILLCLLVVSIGLVAGTIVWYANTHRQAHLLSLTVAHARQTSDGVAVFQPEPHHHYVIVDVAIIHHLSDTAWLAPVKESYIADEHGTKYTMAPYALSHPFDARPYAPGATAAGELSYMVADGAQNLRWCYALGKLPAKCIPIVFDTQN
jgi:hypothetical protein